MGGGGDGIDGSMALGSDSVLREREREASSALLGLDDILSAPAPVSFFSAGTEGETERERGGIRGEEKESPFPSPAVSPSHPLSRSPSRQGLYTRYSHYSGVARTGSPKARRRGSVSGPAIPTQDTDTQPIPSVRHSSELFPSPSPSPSVSREASGMRERIGERESAVSPLVREGGREGEAGREKDGSRMVKILRLHERELQRLKSQHVSQLNALEASLERERETERGEARQRVTELEQALQESEREREREVAEVVAKSQALLKQMKEGFREELQRERERERRERERLEVLSKLNAEEERERTRDQTAKRERAAADASRERERQAVVAAESRHKAREMSILSECASKLESNRKRERQRDKKGERDLSRMATALRSLSDDEWASVNTLLASASSPVVSSRGVSLSLSIGSSAADAPASAVETLVRYTRCSIGVMEQGKAEEEEREEREAEREARIEELEESLKLLRMSSAEEIDSLQTRLASETSQSFDTSQLSSDKDQSGLGELLLECVALRTSEAKMKEREAEYKKEILTLRRQLSGIVDAHKALQREFQEMEVERGVLLSTEHPSDGLREVSDLQVAVERERERADMAMAELSSTNAQLVAETERQEGMRCRLESTLADLEREREERQREQRELDSLRRKLAQAQTQLYQYQCGGKRDGALAQAVSGVSPVHTPSVSPALPVLPALPSAVPRSSGRRRPARGTGGSPGTKGAKEGGGRGAVSPPSSIPLSHSINPSLSQGALPIGAGASLSPSSSSLRRATVAAESGWMGGSNTPHTGYTGSPSVSGLMAAPAVPPEFGREASLSYPMESLQMRSYSAYSTNSVYSGQTNGGFSPSASPSGPAMQRDPSSRGL
ncbi:hypothetical protein KIPB_007206 [Kipferlia bialata]|uniref:Uncharacterized protein n=1 Tax=Kipferlia bialata TaxID=797122 RepID=A0A9K3GJU9_9EUKA|nr:hypothetical protein KIPB_007206 [Kipferlia bialata]|eukprot:g7206.t1